MTIEQFKEKQKAMSDEELIERANNHLDKLCKTYGKSFTMSIPVSIQDTDMIFLELIKRYKSKL